MHEQALNATAQNRLKEFVELAQELVEVWQPCLDEHYPFEQSFDELVRDLLDWNRAVQGRE